MFSINQDAHQLDPRSRRRVHGKVVVVTGAGRGIGRSVAHRLADEGAVLVLADRDLQPLEEVAEEIAAAGAGEVTTFSGDLMEFSTAQALVEAAVASHGRIDVLINNVGGATSLRPYDAWDSEDVLQEMHRSILPTAWCCRAVLPVLKAQRAGTIVNVGAESVRNGLWDRAPYNMAKGAVHALTTSLARENAEFGITCNCVAPAATGVQEGRVQRRAGRQLTDEQQEYVNALNERMIGTIPLGRAALPEEQAAAIVFLASDDASYITGQVLSVNGGSSML